MASFYLFPVFNFLFRSNLDLLKSTVISIH